VHFNLSTSWKPVCFAAGYEHPSGWSLDSIVSRPIVYRCFH